MPKNIEVNLALITYDDQQRSNLELSTTKTAKQHDAHTLHLLQTVPAIGTVLSLVRLDESHDIHRYPRMHDFARLAAWSNPQGIWRQTHGYFR